MQCVHVWFQCVSSNPLLDALLCSISHCAEDAKHIFPSFYCSQPCNAIVMEQLPGSPGSRPLTDQSSAHWTPTERTRDEIVPFLIILPDYEWGNHKCLVQFLWDLLIMHLCEWWTGQTARGMGRSQLYHIAIAAGPRHIKWVINLR